MVATGSLRSLVNLLYNTWLNQHLDSRVCATFISVSSQVDAEGQNAGGPVLGVIGKAVPIPAALLTSVFILKPDVALFTYATAKARSNTNLL